MSAIALLAAMAVISPQEDLERLKELRRAIAQKQKDARALLRAAHESLDRGEYDSAADQHRRGHALEMEGERLRKTEADEIEKAARSLLKDLDDDLAATRDRASRLLIALGPSALPILEKFDPGPSAEVRYRLSDAIAKLKRLEIDSAGRLHQWAMTARASSEYTTTDWSAMQATGKPDTFAAGDAKTAWASLTADGGEEWLELGYEQPVRPTQVRIHETFNPGAVVRVEALDEAGKLQILWEGKDPTTEAIRWFSIEVTSRVLTRSIRLTLDSAAVPGWNEIDAVELVGEAEP